MLKALFVLMMFGSLFFSSGCKKSKKASAINSGPVTLENPSPQKQSTTGAVDTAAAPKNEDDQSNVGDSSNNSIANFPVEEFTLSNGLKVFFSKSKDSPEFYSEIVVRVGSKHEEPGATGLAHYLEHLMFKGTDQIGTTDFEKENALNQQIIAKYEERKAAKTEKEKAAITAEIDQLSLKAAEYVIPGDYESMLSHFGHKYLNAHTSFDETVYYMGMPKNRFSQWAQIQSQVFSKPQIARGFQWELEIVYEEKNRRDSPSSSLLNQSKQPIFGEHGYGRSIIGSTQDLKNPSIKQTIDFFKKYYVPSNLSIVLAGDLEAEEVRKTLEETFGQIPAGQETTYNPPKVTGPTERILTKATFDTEPFVALSFLTPGAISEDSAAFQIFLKILRNGNIGILDELNHQQKIYQASSGILSAGLLTEYNQFYIAAGVEEGEDGQLKKTHEETEKELLQVLEMVKKGEFSEELLVAVKNNYLRENGFLNESNRTKVGALRQAFIYGIPWAEYKKTVEKIMKVSKADVQNFAQKYLSSGYVVSQMHRGPGQVEQVSKPQITPMAGRTAKGDSEFKKKMLAQEVQPLEANFLDFNKDVDVIENGSTQFVVVENPVNDLADFMIEFELGQLADAKTCELVGGILQAGTSSQSALEVKNELFKLGVGGLRLVCGLEKTTLEFSVVEAQLSQALELIGKLLREPKIEAPLLQYLMTIAVRNEKESRKQAEDVVRAALRHFILGDQSPHKTGPSGKELMSSTPADVARASQRLLAAPRTVFYTGKKSAQEIQDLVEKNISFAEQAIAGKERKPLQLKNINKPTIYFYHTSGGAQANVRLIYPSEKFDGQDYQASVIDQVFTRYYARGFSSVITQELREKRSLGYSPSGSYPASAGLTGAVRNGDQKLFIGELNTQTDKLEEGLRVFQDIMKNMIWDAGRLAASQKAYELGAATKIGFRSIGSAYSIWTSAGHQSDPREQRIKAMSSVNLDTIKERMEANIATKTPIILIVGDKTKIDLSPFTGKMSVVELKETDLFSEL